MATKILYKKEFKGIGYSVYQESPNVYQVKIGDKTTGSITSYYMVGDSKIDKTVRAAINQIKKYASDGVISKTEKVKIDKFITGYLKKEGVEIKTLTPITNTKDIKPGAIIMPREVDIVATEDLYIIESVKNSNCKCISIGDDNTISEEEMTTAEIFGGYLIVDYISDDIEGYVNCKKQISVLEKFFIDRIKSITTDINETSSIVDNHLEDFITNAILESDYNGLLKERMISFIEEKANQ